MQAVEVAHEAPAKTPWLTVGVSCTAMLASGRISAKGSMGSEREVPKCDHPSIPTVAHVDWNTHETACSSLGWVSSTFEAWALHATPFHVWTIATQTPWLLA